VPASDDDPEATIVAQPKRTGAQASVSSPALDQVFGDERQLRGTAAGGTAAFTSTSVPPPRAASHSVSRLFSSIPPSFRRGSFGGWVFWILGLAGAIAAAAYGFDPP
jgi:hypothetical protein